MDSLRRVVNCIAALSSTCSLVATEPSVSGKFVVPSAAEAYDAHANGQIQISDQTKGEPACSHA
jgi:hypothetical protein